MVAVVAAVGGEIESDGKPFLPGSEIAPVEGVGILGGGETGVLADCPWLGRVHCRVGPAQERRLARICIEKVETGGIGLAISRLDRDAFRGLPSGAGCIVSRQGRFGKVDLGEIGDLIHLTPRISCAAFNVATASQPA